MYHTMKQLFVLLAALMLAVGASAQKRITDNVDATEGDVKEAVETTTQETAQKSSFGADWGFVKHGYMLDWNLILNGFWITGGNGSQSFNDLKMDISTWRIQVGYNYRYWFNKMFYIQGAAGIGYGHSSVKIGKEKSSDDGCLLTLLPKLGVSIYAGFGIEVGYRFDFSDFKFDKAHRSDYFVLGVVGTF